MYVSFEGHDGAGKTTTAEKVSHILNGRGMDCKFVRAPGTTPFGYFVRSTWHKNPVVRYLQFLAHHVELLDDVIKPHLDRGGWVVQDRTFLSSIVYFSGVVDYSQMLYDGIKWITWPDRLFVLDCPTELAIKRLSEQSKDLPDPDKHEMQKIKMRYKVECLARDGHFIDTASPQLEVIETCLKLL